MLKIQRAKNSAKLRCFSFHSIDQIEKVASEGLTLQQKWTKVNVTSPRKPIKTTRNCVISFHWQKLTCFKLGICNKKTNLFSSQLLTKGCFSVINSLSELNCLKLFIVKIAENTRRNHNFKIRTQ